MQTFLPYPSFVGSAACLDRQRLGKQRIEVLQMLRALTGETKGWANHPCVKAWNGALPLLGDFGRYCCEEWVRRGYKDTTCDRIADILDREGWYVGEDYGHLVPRWFGRSAVHSAYRALLLYKDPTHYGQFGWTETPIERFPWELVT